MTDGVTKRLRQTPGLAERPSEVLPYLAAVSGAEVYVKHSTGKVVSADWKTESDHNCFEVTINAPWGRSVTEISVPAGQGIDVDVHNGTITSSKQQGGLLRLDLAHKPGVPGKEVDSRATVLLRLPR